MGSKKKFPEHQGRVSAFEINAIKNAPPPSLYLLYYYTITVLPRLSPCLMSHLLHHGEAKTLHFHHTKSICFTNSSHEYKKTKSFGNTIGSANRLSVVTPNTPQKSPSKVGSQRKRNFNDIFIEPNAQANEKLPMGLFYPHHV